MWANVEEMFVRGITWTSELLTKAALFPGENFGSHGYAWMSKRPSLGT